MAVDYSLVKILTAAERIQNYIVYQSWLVLYIRLGMISRSIWYLDSSLYLYLVVSASRIREDQALAAIAS